MIGSAPSRHPGRSVILLGLVIFLMAVLVGNLVDVFFAEDGDVGSELAKGLVTVFGAGVLMLFGFFAVCFGLASEIWAKGKTK